MNITRTILAGFILMTLTSCLPASKVPVDTISYPYKEGSRQECLLIFLPGRGDSAGDFEREGLIASFKQTGTKADIIAVDLHFGYYLDMSAIDRLRYDVISQAREQGYHHLLLVGISIGGFAALEYARKYPGEVAEIVLMAPYLGGDRIPEEIISAGGISKWEPGRIAQFDYERRMWAWIKSYKTQGRNMPAVYLGYGKNDRFALSNGVLADAIGPGRTITGPGGHSWATWKKLWNSLTGKISCSNNQSGRLVGADPAEYNK